MPTLFDAFPAKRLMAALFGVAALALVHPAPARAQSAAFSAPRANRARSSA